MAGTVLSRICFYNRVGGTIRPVEWCVINYEGFGPMVEPFWPFPTNCFTVQTNGDGKQNDDFSTANDFGRVDEFLEVDEGSMIKSLNFGTQDNWMHGGRNYPRKGR